MALLTVRELLEAVAFCVRSSARGWYRSIAEGSRAFREHIYVERSIVELQVGGEVVSAVRFRG